MANAVHVHHEDCHAVGLGALRVLISEETDGFFAQGIEIDYSAGGKTLEDAQRRFERGLSRTINRLLHRYGSIDKLLKPTPEDVVSELGGADRYSFEMITVHTLSVDEVSSQFPYNKLQYLKAA